MHSAIIPDLGAINDELWIGMRLLDVEQLLLWVRLVEGSHEYLGGVITRVESQANLKYIKILMAIPSQSLSSKSRQPTVSSAMTPTALWVSMISALSAIEQFELVFVAADKRATLQGN